MARAAIPNSVRDVLAHHEIDPRRVAAEINSLVKSDKYAIFRITLLGERRADLLESTLDPQVAAYISEALADENSGISRKLDLGVVPFVWEFSGDPLIARRGASEANPAWTEFARSIGRVFFRRSTPVETLVLITQSPGDQQMPSAEDLMDCLAWTQIVFDEVVTHSRLCAEPPVRITMRERECLRWCAEGKTSEEIAIILSLSTHTVNHYLISATKKLNAVNRMHAITTAIRLGILDINSPLSEI